MQRCATRERRGTVAASHPRGTPPPPPPPPPPRSPRLSLLFKIPVSQEPSQIESARLREGL
jgi:hypothetical protein